MRMTTLVRETLRRSFNMHYKIRDASIEMLKDRCCPGSWALGTLVAKLSPAPYELEAQAQSSHTENPLINWYRLSYYVPLGDTPDNQLNSKASKEYKVAC
jgi:hypothetical protein